MGPEKINAVTLISSPNWRKSNTPGQYGWEVVGGYEFLILICPFCGHDSPVPWLTEIKSKNPLELGEDLYCPKCETTFGVKDGIATRRE